MSARTESRTVLFVDISDSTKLYSRLGDEDARQVILTALELLREGVLAGGGIVVDQIGDELMCTFGDPANAAETACDLQDRIAAAAAAGRIPESLRVRIGFHHGRLLTENDRIFGDTVHVARRVASASKAQQVLTTRATLDEIPVDRQPSHRFVERTHVKGKSDPIDLIELVWDPISATAMADRPGARAATGCDLLVVGHLDRHHRIGILSPTLTVGRGVHCDVVIEHQIVSRQHARFEYRKGHFYLVDESTNGSQVIDHRGIPRFVHRGELMLAGSGSVVLGPDARTAGVPTLVFRHEAAAPGG